MVTIGPVPAAHAASSPGAALLDAGEFKALEELGYRLGFQHVASGPLVRSSYHADGWPAPRAASARPEAERIAGEIHAQVLPLLVLLAIAGAASAKPADPPAHPCCSSRPSSRPRRPPGRRVSSRLSLRRCRWTTPCRRRSSTRISRTSTATACSSCSPTLNRFAGARTTLDDAILDKDLSVPSPSSACTSSA